LRNSFSGNDDEGSIGCNLTPMLGPQVFYAKLRAIRSLPNVQDVLVEIIEVEEADPSMWPFSDRVYLFTDAEPGDVEHWAVDLQPDAVEEGFTNGEPTSAPKLQSGYRCLSIWWD
jgi:hypothetical protein